MSKATVELFDITEVTPLEIAVKNGEMESAEVLIAAGAQLIIDKNFFRTESRWAQLTGNGETFVALLKDKPGSKAPKEWESIGPDNGCALTANQLQSLHRQSVSHPVPRLLLAKRYSDQANEKFEAASNLFSSFCSLENAGAAPAQSDTQVIEIAPRVADVMHSNIRCDGCGMHPLRGLRYKCTKCPRFDMCHQCFKGHRIDHPLMRIPTIYWLRKHNILVELDEE